MIKINQIQSGKYSQTNGVYQDDILPRELLIVFSIDMDKWKLRDLTHMTWIIRLITIVFNLA